MRRTMLFVPVLVLAAGCGSEEVASEWACTQDRNLWERCENGEVTWCHAFGTPHFHGGAKCALAGLTCTELSERDAICTDDTTTCNAGEFRCDGNSAINCVEGVASIRPCGTLKVCLADSAAGVATCFDERPDAPCAGHGDLFASGCVCDEGYSLDPNDGERCVAG